MALDDIPLFRPAKAGQIVRSDDWNEIQRLLRNAVRQHRHTGANAGNDAAATDDAGQLGTSEIADGAITALKLTAGAVSAGSIADGAITTNKLATAAVTTAKLANSAVTAANMAAAAIGRPALSADVLAQLDRAGASTTASGVVTVAPGQNVQVTHSLGAKPVAVVLAQAGATVQGLQGTFNIFGGPPGGAVTAAVPTTPTGSFFLTNAGRAPVQVLWSAIVITPANAQ
jgi:hypothetical protein